METTNDERRPRGFHHRGAILWLVVVMMAVPVWAWAQPAPAADPLNRAATYVGTLLTGPLARAVAVIAIAVAGYLWMFGEGRSRTIASVLIGGAIAVGATNLIQALFP